MKTNLGTINIIEELPGIITLSHGDLAMAILDTVRFLSGTVENAVYFCLEDGDDLDLYRKGIEEALDLLPEGTVIFIDLFGGSPANQLLLLASERRDLEINAISGMNVSMVLNAALVRNNLKGREIIKDTMKEINGSIVDMESAVKMLREE